MAHLGKHAGWINAIVGTGRGSLTGHSSMKPEKPIMNKRWVELNYTKQDSYICCVIVEYHIKIWNVSVITLWQTEVHYKTLNTLKIIRIWILLSNISHLSSWSKHSNHTHLLFSEHVVNGLCKYHRTRCQWFDVCIRHGTQGTTWLSLIASSFRFHRHEES